MNPTSKAKHIVAITILLLSATTTLRAANVFWTNSATSGWNIAANWSPNQVPGAADLARITNGGTVTIADGGSYTVSNLFVAARFVNNATGTVEITSGTLTLDGVGTAANRHQVGVGTNAFGRIIVNGGTLDRPTLNFMYLGGAGGRGYITVQSGNVFMEQLRIGSDNDVTTRPGFGYLEVSGGLVIITNQITVGRDKETGIMNITGGTVSNLALNALSGVANDDLITISGQQSGTGIVSIATGGTLYAGAGIRISQANAGIGNEGIQDATLRLNGGTLITQRLFLGNSYVTSTNIARVEFDGGTLIANFATNVNGFIYDNLTVSLKAGGVTIDSAGFDLRSTQPFLADAGSPGGGLTKNGAGALTLPATNTYTGTTIINGGKLILATASSGGGNITANGGSGLGTYVSYAGATFNTPTLTLNSGSGSNELDFDTQLLGNPTAPVITATTLNVNRTNLVNIRGALLSVGQFTLIQFTSAPGLTTNHFVLNSLPTTNHQAELVFTSNEIKLKVTAAPSLVWDGQLSADWDLLSTNWLDTSTAGHVLYTDLQAVLFNDTATTNFVNLTTNLYPAAVTVSNATKDYELGGLGQIAGSGGLSKSGAAQLTLTAGNSYAGNTTINAGTVRLGASEVIPHGGAKGNVVINGTLDLNGFNENINGLTGSGVIDNSSASLSTFTIGSQGVLSSFSGLITNSGSGGLVFAKTGGNTLLLSNTNGHSGGTTLGGNGTLQAANDYVAGTGPITMNGGALSSDGTSPRTFTNAVTITADCGFGNAVNNGLITLSSPVAFLNNPVVTVNSDLLITGGSTGSGWHKQGTATITLQGGAHERNDDGEVRRGLLYLDGAAITHSDGTFRVDCGTANSFARAYINTNSSIVLLAAGSSLRSGYDGNVTGTNFLDIAGLVRIPNASSANGELRIGRNGTIGFATLLPGGDVEFRGITGSDTTPAAYSEFNFDGGILRARLDNPNYMQGLSNAFVRARGAIIDSAGVNIGIAQDLQDGGGGGGLTKIGAGDLYLNGVNTYTGGTVVSNGGFGGNGTITGSVLVTSGGTLVPGSSVGTLTVNGTLTLQGGTHMELSRDSGTPMADLAVATTLNRGGSLTISNSGISSLRSGDNFDLFNWTTVNGTFAPVNLPPLLPGLSWNAGNLLVDGTLSISGTIIPPQITASGLFGNNFNVSGTGGVTGGFYVVLTSTDIGLPKASWTPLSTNVFDGGGNFDFSDTFDLDTPERFYTVAIP